MLKTRYEPSHNGGPSIYNNRSRCHNCGEQKNQAYWARCYGCGKPTCDGCEAACSNCGDSAALPRYCAGCFDNPKIHPCAGAGE